MRGFLLGVAIVVAGGCSRRIEEPEPAQHVNANANANADAQANANANAQADADANAQADAQADASVVDTSVADARSDAKDAGPDADAGKDAAADAKDSGTAAAALSAQLVGIWVFAHFDLTDPMTSAKWTAVPMTMKQEILDQAPQASIEFTPKELISRLAGVPDRKSTWTIESVASESELTLNTSAEGRKQLRFIDSSTLRMVDLDKKESFVTIFTRKQSLPVPVPPGKPALVPSSSAGK